MVNHSISSHLLANNKPYHCIQYPWCWHRHTTGSSSHSGSSSCPMPSCYKHKTYSCCIELTLWWARSSQCHRRLYPFQISGSQSICNPDIIYRTNFICCFLYYYQAYSIKLINGCHYHYIPCPILLLPFLQASYIFKMVFDRYSRASQFSEK